MKIKEIEINNFLSLGPDIKINLENRGIVFIRGENHDAGGSNGAGKSSIHESIIWTLFGDTIRGIETQDKVINKQIGSNCLCKVITDTGYVIRTRKHSKYGTSLIHYENGIDVTKSNILSTEKSINQTYNIDYETFISSIVLSSQGKLNFLDSKNNALRRHVIETILGINKYDDYLVITKSKIKDLDTNKEIKNSELSNISNSIESYKNKAKELEEKYQEYEKNKLNKINSINKEIEKISSINVSKNIEIYKQLKETEPIIDAIKNKIKELDWQIAQFNKEIGSLKVESEKYKTLGEKACSYCGSLLDEEKLKTILVPLSKKMESISVENKKLIDELVKQNKNKEYIQSKVAQLKPDITEQALIEIDTKIKMYKDRLTELENEVNPFKIVNFDDEIKKLSDSKNKLDNEINSLIEQLKYYKFWEIGFGNKGLKTYILQDIIDFFNRQIQFYLDILSRGKISIVFDKFLDFSISGLSYANCSSGERRRVDIAVLIALYELSSLRQKTMPNILILDEILDGLDTLGFESVRDLLSELNKKIPTIFVISHNNDLSQYFDKTITVAKENGISYLQ